jgi:hypothetical protein
MYDTWQSVMGQTTFLNDAPVIMKSNMRCITDLSVTESGLGGATATAQDMLFVMQILESMELKRKKPMILYIDNKGAKDVANNWSVGGQTCVTIRLLRIEGTRIDCLCSFGCWGWHV